MIHLLASLILILVMVAAFTWLDRRWWCVCGSRNPWGGNKQPCGSHHAFGVWSLSHVLHGAVFCIVLHVLFGNSLSVPGLLLGTMALEVAWELIENTSHGIEATRLMVDRSYEGDSVGNSIGDVLSCMAGAGIVLVFV